jgi:hypothetical protein
MIEMRSPFHGSDAFISCVTYTAVVRTDLSSAMAGLLGLGGSLEGITGCRRACWCTKTWLVLSLAGRKLCQLWIGVEGEK